METSQIGFGSRIRKSPYFQATRRWGCKAYSVYNRTYLPLYYESPVADYWRLIEDVTLWDVGCQRQVEIAGPDAAAFTQLLTPRNLANCAVGQCKYVLLTDESGGIVNDPVLLRLAEDRFWLSLADSDVLLWAKGAALNAGLDVSIREPNVWPLQLQGPKSSMVMRAVFGAWIDDLRYFRFRETEWNGARLLISRTGWSHERGYEIFLRGREQGDALWEAIMAAGQAHGIAPGAPSAIRRIEAGLLSYGADMTLAENPFELGMDRFIDLDMDARFIGKSALARIKADGVRRRLIGLEIASAPFPGPNQNPWPVLAGETRVGTLTSGIYSPRLDRNIGLALVDMSHRDTGTNLTVATPEITAQATVVNIPFVDPDKERVE